MASALLDETVQPLVPLPRRPRLAPSLPAPATGLVGRERELAAVADLLADHGVRLVTLTGPGGVGKTRLALAALAAADAAFADGAAFVDLAFVGDPVLVPSAIAAALGVRETADEPLARAIESFLRTRHALLVLDNFEHLLAAAAVASALVATCPDLTLLVTSRAPLRLSGEHAYPVGPLTLPSPAAPLEAVAAAEAVRLFMARARAAQPDFRLAEANAASVAAICRRLDGLPLAIELAAARVAAFPPPAMLDRLERRLPVPLEGPRDAPARQRTLAAAIAWSHDLLSADDQALFRRLAVFSGGFPLDAAGSVARREDGETGRRGEGTTDHPTSPRLPVSPSSVVGGVVSLVEQALLHGAGPAAAEPDARYAMLETVREFALDRLDASGETEETRRRHAAWCLGLVERVEPELWAAPAESWLDRLEADLGNLRAALAWGLEHEPETTLRLAGGLWRFWERRRYQAEGRAWLERGLERGAGADPAVRAKALSALGTILSYQDELLRAAPTLEEAVALSRQVGDRTGLARALLALGEALQVRGDAERSNALLAEAGLLFSEPEDARSLAALYQLLGIAAFHAGDMDRSASMHERALDLVRGSGDRAFEANQLANLAIAAGEGGDPHRGAALSAEAVALYRAIDDRTNLSIGLMNLSDYVGRLGEPERALALLQEGLAVALEDDKREWILYALQPIADHALRFGRPAEAARFLGACDALRAASGISPKPHEVALLDDLVGAVTAALGEAGMAAARDAGRLAPWEAVVADALALAPPAPTANGTPPADVPADVVAAAARLTVRERDVLRLLVDGRADKEIAAALFISPKTVSKHVETIRGKLGVDSRTAAVAFAVRHGLV